VKIALVHDDFMQAGGAESLFATIASLYPDAPIYTSLVNWQKVPQTIDPKRIRTSFMQRIPFAKKFFKALLPLYPLAFESFNFDKFDLVISSTTRFAKSIITKPETVHVSYINSIPRFLWNKHAQENYLPKVILKTIGPILKWLKKWDRASSSRVDFYIANSQNIAEKIIKIYQKEAVVVYPFANTNYFTPPKIHNWELKSQNYYLIVTRLVKWKRVDIAIKAAMDLNVNLFIVGDGPDKQRLNRLVGASENIHFLGKIAKSRLLDLYRNCQALIITQEEDFGIAAVEAQSCGRPVIGFRKGGVFETVIEKQTGIFFDDQNEKSLKDAIGSSSRVKWSEGAIRKNGLRFSRAVFGKEFTKAIKIACQNPTI